VVDSKPGPAPKDPSGAAKPMTFRVSPAMQERVRKAAKSLEISQADVLVMGVLAAEAKLARRKK
jgi:hypothetical protein